MTMRPERPQSASSRLLDQYLGISEEHEEPLADLPDENIEPLTPEKSDLLSERLYTLSEELLERAQFIATDIKSKLLEDKPIVINTSVSDRLMSIVLLKDKVGKMTDQTIDNFRKVETLFEEIFNTTNSPMIRQCLKTLKKLLEVK